VLFATAAAFLLVAFAASAATAAPMRSDKLTAAEQKWVTPVLQLWNLMNADLSVVDKQMAADAALIPGTKTNKTLITTLGNFVTCPKAMVSAKAPPTVRLKTFAASMKGACADLSKGAQGIANGISTIYKKHNAKLATLQIKAARQQLVKASSQLATARKQIVAVSR
jgi:hypothetical protein